MMAGNQKPREGYGGTSEQRQRGLEGDTFSERLPRSPDEFDAARAEPEKGGHVVRVDVSPGTGAPEQVKRGED
jgi:hypothetical protein